MDCRRPLVTLAAGWLLTGCGISALVQSGWQVSYTQYSNQGEFDLPGRIALDNGKMKLRLVIRSWNL